MAQHYCVKCVNLGKGLTIDMNKNFVFTLCKEHEKEDIDIETKKFFENLPK